MPRSRHWRRSRQRRSRPQGPLFAKTSFFPPSSGQGFRSKKSPPLAVPFGLHLTTMTFPFVLARGGLDKIGAAKPLPRPIGRNIAHDIIRFGPPAAGFPPPLALVTQRPSENCAHGTGPSREEHRRGRGKSFRLARPGALLPGPHLNASNILGWAWLRHPPAL